MMATVAACITLSEAYEHLTQKSSAVNLSACCQRTKEPAPGLHWQTPHTRLVSQVINQAPT